MIENNIRLIRRRRGITLAQLAMELGLTQPSLTRIENGTQPLTMERIVQIADALRCTPADILPVAWTLAFDVDRFFRILAATNRALADLKLDSDEQEKLKFVFFLYRQGCGMSQTPAANDNEIMGQIKKLYNMVA